MAVKKIVCLLLALLFFCAPANAFNFKDSLPELPVQPAQPSNEEKPWLPDPEGVFGVPGELASQEEYAGVMYSLYSYRFYMDMEELVDAEFAYRDRLEEHHGYTALEAEPENALSYVMLYLAAFHARRKGSRTAETHGMHQMRQVHIHLSPESDAGGN